MVMQISIIRFIYECVGPRCENATKYEAMNSLIDTIIWMKLYHCLDFHTFYDFVL